MKLHEAAGSYMKVQEATWSCRKLHTYIWCCMHTGPYAICSMHYACTMQAWQTVSGRLSPHLTLPRRLSSCIKISHCPLRVSDHL